jgi:HSP20 family protein
MAGRITHPQPAEISEQLRERLRRLLLHLEDVKSFVPPPGAWHPAVDLCEMDDAIVMRVEIPGLRSDDIRLTIRDNTLKIEGRKLKHSAGLGLAGTGSVVRYHCLERTYGSFSRTFSLECPVRIEGVSASLQNGVLEIRLPKTPSCGHDVLIPITE